MKAVLALVFFACIAGSMASSGPMQIVDSLIQQGQAVAGAIIGQLQQQIVGFVQNALSQLSSVVGSMAGRAGIVTEVINNVQQMLEQYAGLALNQVHQFLGSLTQMFAGNGRALGDIGSIFGNFFNEIKDTLTSMGQHVLNQGLGAVLGGLGGLGGRGIGDIFSSLSQQVGAAVTAAQGALQGALGSLASLGANLLDASKPHWEQLQEQLTGHGLNVLGSISESISNLHGSITGGR